MTNEEIVKESFRIMKEYIEDGKETCKDIEFCEDCPFEDWDVCPYNLRKVVM